MSSYPSAEQAKIMVRMPRSQRDDLKIRAIRNGNTLNAEVMHLIETAIDHIDSSKTGCKSSTLPNVVE